jgi:hypothetical protein
MHEARCSVSLRSDARRSVPPFARRIPEFAASSYREEEAATSLVLTNGHHIDAHQIEDGSWIAAVDGRGLSAQKSPTVF